MGSVSTEVASDAQLVAGSRAGDREAFRHIVERYQNLIASVAYCATGNLSQSEDLAQETFLAAWSKLGELREPANLRSWLCSLVRFRISKEVRRQHREPTHAAEPLDLVNEVTTAGPTPVECAITEEEKLILWRSLGRIPEIYREPLVLYYREQQSIAAVARSLEASEETVRQRLSRGRKMLHEEVRNFVESALGRTAPGKEFSASVLLALPAVSSQIVALGGAATAKSTAGAKAGFLSAWLAPLAPFLGIAAGVFAQWLLIRDVTSDPNMRRKRLVQVIAAWTIYLAAAVTGEMAVHWLCRHFGWDGRTRFIAVVGFWWMFLVVTIGLQFIAIRKWQLTSRKAKTPDELRAACTTPMKAATLAMVVIGAHLMMFGWLMALTWRLGDLFATAVAGAVMVLLMVVGFVRQRGRTAALVAHALAAQLAVAGAFILLLINLRAEVWVAQRYGVSVSRAHELQPLWLIPVLSLVLVLCALIGIAWTRNTERERNAQQ